jgi:hypothetical protein
MEFSVTITLKPVEVSAATPAEAVVKASQQVADDLSANVTWVTALKLDRIKVAGLGGPR